MAKKNKPVRSAETIAREAVDRRLKAAQHRLSLKVANFDRAKKVFDDLNEKYMDELAASSARAQEQSRTAAIQLGIAEKELARAKEYSVRLGLELGRTAEQIVGVVRWFTALGEGDWLEKGVVANLLLIAAIFCPLKEREQIIGHMEERYPSDRAKYGALGAKVLIVSDIVRMTPTSVKVFVLAVIAKIKFWIG